MQLIKKYNLLVITIITLLFVQCRKGDYYIKTNPDIYTDNGSGIGTQTWTADMDITINGYVFVNDGQVLTIEPGTVVKFKTGQGAAASALIVARGGIIVANGTNSNPIIFTSELDNLDGNLPPDTSGLWGGIIILGNAPVNTTTGEANVEGIPSNELRGVFGGNNENDYSGQMSYVSIRHAGSILHHDNEINGLTLGGVGNKTIIENIEVVSVADDGIEVFGGTVNLKNIVIANFDDDAFDFDLGYKGNVQYLLAIKNNTNADCLIEGSGANELVNPDKLSALVIANATLIGNTLLHNNTAVKLNNSARLVLANSIICYNIKGVSLQFTDAKTDTYSQFANNKIIIANNIFFDVAKNIADSVFCLYPNPQNIDNKYSNTWQQYFTVGSNVITNPVFLPNSKLFIPQITNYGSVYILPENSFFTTAKHKGAFLNYDWTDGWTFYKSLE